MENSIKIFSITFSLILLTSFCFAQKGRGGGNGQPHNHKNHQAKMNHHNKVVVKRSVYRPKKVVVYHPGWAPKRNYNRRWVYFPRYNFYWDNWRQVYVYRNSTIWVSNPTPPPIIINIKIEDEKHYELKDNDDDIDDIYKTNDTHIIEYKPD